MNLPCLKPRQIRPPKKRPKKLFGPYEPESIYLLIPTITRFQHFMFFVTIYVKMYYEVIKPNIKFRFNCA